MNPKDFIKALYIDPKCKKYENIYLKGFIINMQKDERKKIITFFYLGKRTQMVAETVWAVRIELKWEFLSPGPQKA